MAKDEYISIYLLTRKIQFYCLFLLHGKWSCLKTPYWFSFNNKRDGNHWYSGRFIECECNKIHFISITGDSVRKVVHSRRENTNLGQRISHSFKSLSCAFYQFGSFFPCFEIGLPIVAILIQHHQLFHFTAICISNRSNTANDKQCRRMEQSSQQKKNSANARYIFVWGILYQTVPTSAS